MTAVDIVQSQLDAYNARDLKRFVAMYSETIRICRLPSCEPLVSNKRELADLYASRVFSAPSLHAEILHRMVLGNKVVDHERISGLRETPSEAIAVYEVAEGLIQRVWFLNPD